MVDNILQHCEIALEMVNAKIKEIYHEVESDEDGDAIDDEELEELYRCIMIKSKIGKLYGLKTMLPHDGGHTAHSPALAALKTTITAGL